jgi:archaeal chaperonin
MVMQGQPVIILRENTDRNVGREAQKNNIAAASAIAEAVRSTLGPRGMDKMLVDSLGDVLITNDGATILDELEVEHPAAKLIIQVSKSQDKEVGDGTTSAVVIAGELLKLGDELLEKKVHGTTIVAGYKKAVELAIESLNELAVEAKLTPDELQKIAVTALNSKSVHSAKAHIARLAVEAVLHIREEKAGKVVANLDNVKILQKQGKGLGDSELIKGIAIDKDILHSGMPKSVKNAKIALINANIEISKTEFDSEIRISDPNMVQHFLDNEQKIIKEMVEKIAASGANFVVCQKGIDDMAQYFMAKKGIAAVRRVKKSDMEKLARATGGKIVSSLDEISETSLGSAGHIYQTKLGDDDYIYVEDCASPLAVTVLLRGSSKYATDEAERAMTDALSVVRNVVEDGLIVPGGGATEVHIYNKIDNFAKTEKSKERLAIQAFADSMLVIPRTLAENSGMDPIDKVAELTSYYTEGKKGFGLDIENGTITDMFEAGIVEPIRVKKQALKSAAEAAEMILRIDDVIATKGGKDDHGPQGMPPGMPPGMGGMGGMPPGMM